MSGIDEEKGFFGPELRRWKNWNGMWTHEILAIIRFLVAENRRTFDGVEKWVSVMLPISHTMAS
jgi:hypothetical protein